MKEPRPRDWMQVERDLRAEADRLLSSGLRDLLARYGEVHVVGSYVMRLMAWRDLDIHLVSPVVDKATFFELGSRIAHLLSPHRMRFRDETEVATVGLPRGLYWGVYLGDETEGAWKIDLWATGTEGLTRVLSYCEGIRRRLSPSNRETILRIKSRCWRLPEYRRDFASADIYEAVLDHGVADMEGFSTYLAERARSRDA